MRNLHFFDPSPEVCVKKFKCIPGFCGEYAKDKIDNIVTLVELGAFNISATKLQNGHWAVDYKFYEDGSYDYDVLDDRDFRKWLKRKRKKAQGVILDLIKQSMCLPDSARRPSEHSKWAKLVKRRDKACVNCGSSDNLEAHHIKPWKTFPELRFEISNGVTLCKECHKLAHKRNKHKFKWEKT